MTHLLNIVKRYDRLVVLVFGALMTFFTVYAKFNNMFNDLQSNKAAVATLNSEKERVEIFMEKQTLIDSRQNEILSDLKDQMKSVWHSGRGRDRP